MATIIADERQFHMILLIWGILWRNWTNKQNRVTLIDGEQMTASGDGGSGGGIEQKGKSTHGHGQQCGGCWGEGGIRELNGNGKIQ